jgi:hypothetical protein
LPGSSDMEKSLQSCCGPFWGLEKWSNCVKLGKIHKLLQKQSIVFLFSIYFRFVFVSLFFSIVFFVFVLFVFDSCQFSSFLNQIWQNPKMQKTLSFCLFFRVFFRIMFEPKRPFQFIFKLFSNPKSNLVYFRTIFEPRKNFELFSNLKHILILFSRHYRCDCHSDLRDPGKICCNKLKVMFWEHSVTMIN